MKNKIFILGAIMGSFVLGSCGDFLEEESQSEVIPKTTSDFSELLLGTGYPDESTPNFSFLSLMDDDCAHFLTYASPWNPEGTVETLSPSSRSIHGNRLLPIMMVTIVRSMKRQVLPRTPSSIQKYWDVTPCWIILMRP